MAIPERGSIRSEVAALHGARAAIRAASVARVQDLPTGASWCDDPAPEVVVEQEVTLREVRDEDLPLFFEQDQDPVALHMAAFTRKDPGDRAAFEAHWAKIRRSPEVVLRTIVWRGEVVGSVASFLMFGDRDVTYGIARRHWGQGIATAALRRFLAEVETRRPLHARAAADNAGSLRVLSKCGFARTGSERGFANARGAEIDEAVLRLE